MKVTDECATLTHSLINHQGMSIQFFYIQVSELLLSGQINRLVIQLRFLS